MVVKKRSRNNSLFKNPGFKSVYASEMNCVLVLVHKIEEEKCQCVVNSLGRDRFYILKISYM